MRLERETRERDAKHVADNRAGMEREDRDRRYVACCCRSSGLHLKLFECCCCCCVCSAFLLLVAQVFMRARMEAQKRSREQQARELVAMRREDALSA